MPCHCYGEVMTLYCESAMIEPLQYDAMTVLYHHDMAVAPNLDVYDKISLS